MAHGKETPRQKMIGMMYLVLTALLALNVSKDVLNAFVLVDRGLTETTENFAKKNNSIYSDFDQAYIQNETKVSDWREKALTVQKMSDSLIAYMDECKREIVLKSEGEKTEAIVDGKIDLILVSGKDNTDVPAEVMINGKRGEILKER
jgi:gliding motility-associated protein GldM